MQTSADSAVFHAEYLSALLGSIDESVVATNENFIIEYWNKGAQQIFGYTAQETVGQKAATIFNFIYQPEQEQQARSELITKGHWKGRLNFRDKNHVLKLADASVTAVKNKDGNVIGYVGVHRDITEFDQAKTSLQTLLSIMSSMDDSFFIVDRDLRIAHINEKTNQNTLEMYGFTYKVGDMVAEKLPAYRKEQIKDCFRVALQGERNSYTINILTPKGNSMWIQATYFPLINEQGIIAHACALVRDITAQKEIEIVNEKLYKSRHLFETFMENSPILAWITDSKEIIRYLKPHYLQSHQLQKQAIGKSIFEVFPVHIANVFKENNQKVMALNEVIETTEKSMLEDNKEHIYRVIKFPLHSNDETLVGGWAVDITEEIELRETLTKSLDRLKRSETELKDALAKEHQLNDIKSRFVSMASHEFRTPLSTILSSSFLLEKYNTGEYQANRSKHLHRIKEAVHHTNSLLEDFLSLGKLEEGKTNANFSEFNLPELIHNVVEELELIKKNGQEIVFFHKGPNKIVNDNKLVKAILINLLSNSIKFSEENRKICINSHATKKEVTITIKDEGIGISKKDQEHLFESFYRGRNAQNIQGTGLGLHIVKRYLQLLQGEINLQSVMGKGTTVTVVLPKQRPTAIAEN